MADPIEVDTDLVCSSCLKTALHHGHITETLKHLVVGHCMLAMITVRENLESHTVIRITADVSCDSALVLLEVAPHDSHIASLDRVYEELLCKVELSLVVLCNNEKTGCILVDTMHKHTHSFVFSIRALRNAKVMSQSIYKSAAEMSMARMNNHAGLLVEHKHVIILMDNVQRNSLRKDLKSTTLIRHNECHHITGTHNIVCLYDLVVYTDILRLYGKLDAMAGCVFHVRRKILVDAHRNLTCSDVKAVMLEHLLLFILIRHLVAHLSRIEILFYIEIIFLEIHNHYSSTSSARRYRTTSVPIITDSSDGSGACLYTTHLRLSSIVFTFLS